MTNEDILLSVRDLHVQFTSDIGPVKAVDGISFDLKPGEVLGIVGESGSGKSATGLSLMGLIPSPPGKVIKGSIFYQGQDILSFSEAKMNTIRGKEISMVFQDPMTTLNPYLTIQKQLTEILEVHHSLGQAEAKEKSIELLTRVGIRDAADRIHQYPHQFSGGMRQRVVIAMALLCRPSLIIADEPTTALDVTVQAQILALLADLVEQEKTSIIIITHDLGVVAQLADQVAVMYAGRFVEHGPVQQVLQHPAHPYTKGLLESVPRLDLPQNHRLQAIAGSPPNLAKLPVGCTFAARCKEKLDICEKSYPESTQISSAHTVAHTARCFALGESA